MSLKSLKHLLGSLNNHDSWQSHRQFQKLLACWFEIVGPAVAAHTRPVAVQRQILQVATSSPAWAQNLAFERHRILAKLNAHLSSDLIDIRFSTAQWYRDDDRKFTDASTLVWQNHPSQLNHSTPLPSTQASETFPTTDDPVTAFNQWARVMQERSHHLPLCPQCKCPTPTGELQRWSVCALCATKKW